jgi:hypothetical protein
VNKGTKVIAIAFVVTSAIATSALGQSAHTWYDGGGEVPDTQFGHGEPTCQKTGEDDSPAESYKNLKYFGSQPQIIDKGDEVDVQGSDGTVFRFFRTQKACKQFAIQLRAKIKTQQDEKQKPLNPYE